MIKDIIICFVVGCFVAFGLVKASGALLSDEDYAKAHPEAVENERWELFENPNSIIQNR